MIEDKGVFTKTFGIILVGILFVLLMTFLVVDGYFSLDRDIKINSADAKDMIDQRLSFMISEMNFFPEDIEEDLIFISRISSLEKLLSTKETSALESLENDFLEFLKQGIGYYQIRYIDENGNEITRVEFDGEKYIKIPKEKLQDKSQTSYFIETMKLDSGETFISPLDLNTENGEKENRGTTMNPIYIPVIRTSTPVFDDESTRKGIVIIDMYADYFLDDIRSSQTQGEEIFLINEDGYYLANPQREKEFSFLLGEEHNFYKDYSSISKTIVLNEDKRQFESEDYIFSFRKIYPFSSSEAFYRKYKDNKRSEYFWILISVSEKASLEASLTSLKKEYIYFLLSASAVVLAILSMVFFLIFKSNSEQKEMCEIKGGKKRK